MNHCFPDTGRLAGLDYGHVRIGVAVCDVGRTLASPLEVRRRQGRDSDAAFFRALVEREELVGFVIGLPIHASGDESEKSKEARAFGRWLQELTGLPVAYQDERYSSVEAEKTMQQAGRKTRKQRREKLDMIAAQIILMAFLEKPHRDTPPGSLD